MIRVLVAEDERPIARNICKMIELINPEFEVVRVVYNGQQAVEVLHDQKIEVVFLDINMPIINGIQVLEHVYTEKIDIISVMLTGYEDFTYAQSSLRYQAFDYLLKPIDKVLLRQCLDKIYTIIQRKHREEEMFSNTKIPHELFESQETLGRECYFGVLYLGSNAEVWEEESIEKQERCEVRLRKLLSRYLGEKAYWLTRGKINAEKLLFIDSRQNGIELILGNILKEIEKEIPISIGIASEKIVIEDIREMSEQIKHDLSQCMYLNKSVFIRYPIIIDEEARKLERDNMDIVLNQITESSTCEQVMQLAGQVILLSDGVRKQIAYGMKRLLSKLCDKIHTEYNFFDFEDEIVQAMNESYSVEMLLEKYKVILESYFCFQTSLIEDRLLLTERMKSYIEKHYDEMISNQKLENVFGYVHFHLREIFREAYQITPNDYMLQVKMEHAKEMLALDMQAKDVAKNVGYNDPLYFSKVFKKNVGCTPSQYKNRLKKCEE